VGLATLNQRLGLHEHRTGRVDARALALNGTYLFDFRMMHFPTRPYLTTYEIKQISDRARCWFGRIENTYLAPKRYSRYVSFATSARRITIRRLPSVRSYAPRPPGGGTSGDVGMVDGETSHVKRRRLHLGEDGRAWNRRERGVSAPSSISPDRTGQRRRLRGDIEAVALGLRTLSHQPRSEGISRHRGGGGRSRMGAVGTSPHNTTMRCARTASKGAPAAECIQTRKRSARRVNPKCTDVGSASSLHRMSGGTHLRCFLASTHACLFFFCFADRPCLLDFFPIVQIKRDR
jgi:hypothetical protein